MRCWPGWGQWRVAVPRSHAGVGCKESTERVTGAPCTLGGDGLGHSTSAPPRCAPHFPSLDPHGWDRGAFPLPPPSHPVFFCGCDERHRPELWVWSHVHHSISGEVGGRGQSIVPPPGLRQQEQHRCHPGEAFVIRAEEELLGLRGGQQGTCRWGQCSSQVPSARPGHRGHQHLCPLLPQSPPPSPRCLMARVTWKLSSLLVWVTDATEAPRTRYWVSLVRQRLCREAEVTGAPENLGEA